MNRLLSKLVVMLGCIILLAACGSQEIEEYQHKTPALDLRHYFDGQIKAWGMFQKRGGTVVKRFEVLINASTQGDKLILDEHFSYDDGTTQQRTWTLTEQADGSWRGSAADVVGDAIGVVAGNALNWRYTLLLPVDGDTYKVNFDDWMYLLDDQHMINRASMSKFGFELGQVTLFFAKQEANHANRNESTGD